MHLSMSFCGWEAYFFFNPEITSHVMGSILSLKDSCLLGSHFDMGFISQTQSYRNLRFEEMRHRTCSGEQWVVETLVASGASDGDPVSV